MAQRAAEVARHTVHVMTRGAIRFGPGAGLLSRATVMGHTQMVIPAATLNAYGIPLPNAAAGQSVTVIHLDFPWGPPFYHQIGTFLGPGLPVNPQSVNVAGPINAAALGQIISCDHLGVFQFAPAAAPQTQAVLAAGVPAVGGANITSYNAGYGTWTSVRAIFGACAPLCSQCC